MAGDPGEPSDMDEFWWDSFVVTWLELFAVVVQGGRGGPVVRGTEAGAGVGGGAGWAGGGRPRHCGRHRRGVEFTALLVLTVLQVVTRAVLESLLRCEMAAGYVTGGLWVSAGHLGIFH